MKLFKFISLAKMRKINYMQECGKISTFIHFSYILQHLFKLKMPSSEDQAIPLLGLFPIEILTQVQKETYKSMFTVTFL